MVNRVTTSSSVKSIKIWWDDFKFYVAITLSVVLCLTLGFTLGHVYSKRAFDQVAINSGHAQYHPTKGYIEWKSCK